MLLRDTRNTGVGRRTYWFSRTTVGTSMVTCSEWKAIESRSTVCALPTHSNPSARRVLVTFKG